MRKNIIALMLALPLLFIFVVFSSGNVVSLSVPVSVNGIEILEKPEENTLRLDLAEYNNDYVLKAEVKPANASDKNYSFRVEEVEGTQRADVSVDGATGKVIALSPGMARIVAVSRDGGYTDSVDVVVGSSKPFDFDFFLSQDGGGEIALAETAAGYRASVRSGRFRYTATLEPSGFTGLRVKPAAGYETLVGIDEAAGTILLPFSGEVRVELTVPDGCKGDIVKSLALNVARAETTSGFTVNGGAGATVALEKGKENASFYVEADEEPVLTERNGYLESVETVRLGEKRYRMDVTFRSEHPDSFEAEIAVGGKSDAVSFSFLDFAFEVRSDLPVQGSGQMSVLKEKPVTFFAFPAGGMSASGVTYRWSVNKEAEDTIVLSPNADGTSCVLTAKESISFTLTVQALKGGLEMDIEPHEMKVDVVRNVNTVQIAGNTKVGLAEKTVLAGKRYENGQEAANRLALRVFAYDVNTPVEGFSDLAFRSSDPKIATVQVSDEGVFVVPAGGKGEVTVEVSWQGNETFNTSVRAAVTYFVVSDAVEVVSSEELYRAQAAARPTVLGKNIMLGADANNDPLPREERKALLLKMRSTYNIDYYTNRGKDAEAYVKYALEIKSNIYGNGFFIDANYLTNVKDNTGIEDIPDPDFFAGPIHFVSMGGLTSVAGQDNIAFLMRTDGVTLYNVNLLGCSDSALSSESEYELTNLETVGTTLEVNASVSLLNCRIRNGRNVVRTYGGNRDGEHYFLESLNDNPGCNDERITVRIEGCIISQGREFLLKIGANRALRACTANGGLEPSLLQADKKTPYSWQNNSHLNDDYFYEYYVMTDVTLKDSVLETSGLFTVGLESNFSGNMLYKELESGFDGWAGTGGTSFASLLRLEGDVRLYDWKDLAQVDSSTLIETAGSDKRFKLEVGGMLDYVCKNKSEYANIMEERDGKQYVHGGIAFYGGGKNYSQLSTEKLVGSARDFSEYLVNISVLEGSSEYEYQAKQLPRAAGSQDFRFYLYGTDSANNLAKQEEDSAKQQKYVGVKPVAAP